MKTAIILKWLIASWKSTLAHKYRGEWYVVFSRDQARLDNPWMNEVWISYLEKQFILEWYDSILIDNCHMWEPSLEKIKLFCQWNWYMVEVIDMFDICQETTNGREWMGLWWYLRLCLLRNSEREWQNRVPDSVVYQMYLQNYALVGDKDWCVIVDIDWTISECSHRLHYLDETPKNHDAFYEEVDKDAPIEQVIDIVKHLSEKHFIILTSGRRNQSCGKTVERLRKYNVPYDALLMRQWWDRRPDTEVKKEIYDKCLANKNIIMAIDDRRCIIDLWKSLWIFTIWVSQRENDNF